MGDDGGAPGDASDTFGHRAVDRGLVGNRGSGQMPYAPPAATGTGVLPATDSEAPPTTRGEQQGAVATLVAELRVLG